MAPVFDQIHQEEGAPLTLRLEGLWQGSERRADDRVRRDGDKSGGDDRDSGKGHDSDDNKQKSQKGSGVLVTIDPLNPLPGVASGFASLIAPSPPPSPTQPPRTSGLSTSTTSSSTASTTSSSTTSTTSSSTASTTSPSPSLPSSSSTTTLSTLSLPTLSVNNPVAINPQASVSPVVTISSMTIMTTTSFATPSAAPSQSFIDSIFPSMKTTTSSSPTAAFESDAPSPTIFLTDTDTDGDNHHDIDSHDGSLSGPPPGGLSPTAEDVLISAGSIGAFILICFVCWIGWRMYKKSKGLRDMSNDAPPNALLARIPYFGRNQRAWNDFGDGPDMRGPPSMYDQSSAKSIGAKVSMYSMTDARYMAQSPARQGPTMLPQLDTNVSYSNANPFSASTQSSAMNSHSTYSSQGLSMQTVSYPQQQQQPAGLPQLQTNFGPMRAANDPFASPEDALTYNNLSPNSTLNYGNGTMQTFETTSTDRSRMPDPYYNQSELARQASTAFDPAKRAVYRASELSSISSGFGDGDFIVPPPAAAQQGARPFSYAKTSRSRSNSVANRSEVGSAGQRDTVYTTTSEDMPARYRSVNSWVNQQTGRVQRQQERAADEDVPPVPSLPPEERLTMMMDDGEEPRRYEDTLSPQPPVPALPSQHASASEASNTEGNTKA